MAAISLNADELALLMEAFADPVGKVRVKLSPTRKDPVADHRHQCAEILSPGS